MLLERNQHELDEPTEWPEECLRKLRRVGSASCARRHILHLQQICSLAKERGIGTIKLSARSTSCNFSTYKPAKPAASYVTKDISVPFRLRGAICPRQKKDKVQCQANRCSPLLLRVFPVTTAEELRDPIVDIFKVALYAIA